MVIISKCVECAMKLRIGFRAVGSAFGELQGQMKIIVWLVYVVVTQAHQLYIGNTHKTLLHVNSSTFVC